VLQHSVAQQEETAVMVQTLIQHGQRQHHQELQVITQAAAAAVWVAQVRQVEHQQARAVQAAAVVVDLLMFKALTEQQTQAVAAAVLERHTTSQQKTQATVGRES
jgi:hypothetical protein